MNQNIQFAGIDVDDKAYHVNVFDTADNSSVSFKCDPSPELFVRALKKHCKKPKQIKLCYEASYIGYSLYRNLSKQGYDCKIAAPSLIPRQAGVRQKTDKLDAKKLATYYAKDLLTFINIPSEEDESVRSMLRSRVFLIQQRTMLKNHMNGICRTLGINYYKETTKKSKWTSHHLEWLHSRINKLEDEATKFHFKILYKQYEDTIKNIDLFEIEIERLSKRPIYEKKVKALTAFKGVKVNTALTLITELGDIRRFDHPKRITSYAGFDIVEYSSGGESKRYGISKMGNANIRKAAVDAVKFAIRSPVAGVALRERRKELDPELSRIASKCNTRLYKRGCHLLHAGKPKKKIQVACAREFLGFVWEALNKVA